MDLADRTHFVRITAKLMREILVDHARRFNAAKRDGGERVGLTNLVIADERSEVDVVGLDAVLAQLEQIDAGQGPDRRTALLRRFDHRGNGGSDGHVACDREAALDGGAGVVAGCAVRAVQRLNPLGRQPLADDAFRSNVHVGKGLPTYIGGSVARPFVGHHQKPEPLSRSATHS